MVEPAMLYLMVGLPGAGKTTRAKELERERRALRLTLDDWMIPLFGENNDRDRDILEGRLIWLAMSALRLGTSVILDFGFWTRDERASLRWIAGRLGAQSKVIYLPVEAEEQARRIRERFKEAPERNWVMTEADLAEWRALFEEPDSAELSGVSLPPPKEFDTWSSWAAQRWPSLPNEYE